MDRFFSKLDLRDIKIDPFKTSFPPDADEGVSERPQPPQHGPGEDAAVAEAAPGDVGGSAEPAAAPGAPSWEVRGGGGAAASDRRPHVPAWASGGAGGSEAGGQVNGAVPAPAAAPVEAMNGRAEAALAPAGAGAAVAGGADLAPNGAAIEQNGEVLKVSARSRPSAVAGAIAGVVREAGRAEVQAIGAGATNQAVKAVAIARDYLRETGIEAVCLPAFIDVTIENEDRTAIRLVVEPR